MIVVRQCSKCGGPARCARSRDVLAGRRRLYVCRKCNAQWQSIEVLDGVGDATAVKVKAFEQFIVESNDALQKAITAYKA